MDNVIAEYQKWKQQGHSLRGQAKQAMETRFRDLLTEAAQVAQEYHHDFGSALKPPPSITAFRFKPANARPKKALPPKVAGAKPANPTLAPLEKHLVQTRNKLEAAKAAGKKTQSLEDKIYEIEDAIRLATQTGSKA